MSDQVKHNDIGLANCGITAITPVITINLEDVDLELPPVTVEQALLHEIKKLHLRIEELERKVGD